MENDILINRVSLQGEGFKDDSPVLNDGLLAALPCTELVVPLDDGVKSLAHHVSLLKSLAHHVS